MVLQVAAATNCKHYYGVEKADIPATYAEVTPLSHITDIQTQQHEITAFRFVLVKSQRLL